MAEKSAPRAPPAHDHGYLLKTHSLLIWPTKCWYDMCCIKFVHVSSKILGFCLSKLGCCNNIPVVMHCPCDYESYELCCVKFLHVSCKVLGFCMSNLGCCNHIPVVMHHPCDYESYEQWCSCYVFVFCCLFACSFLLWGSFYICSITSYACASFSKLTQVPQLCCWVISNYTHTCHALW